MSRETLRSLSIYALLMATGAGAGYALVAPATPDVVPAVPTPARASGAPEASSLAPTDVVEAQMRALQAFASDPSAIERVFAHASPANRAVTGPLPRFAAMVRRPPFDVLVGCASWTIGSVAQRDNVASLLVVVVDRQGVATPFRFLLRRQPDDLGGRWMTEGVFPALDPMAGAAPTI